MTRPAGREAGRCGAAESVRRPEEGPGAPGGGAGTESASRRAQQASGLGPGGVWGSAGGGERPV